MIKAMETRPCEARAKEWELFCLEEAGESLQNPSAEMNHANPRQPRRSPHLQFSPGGGGGRRPEGPATALRVGALITLWLPLSTCDGPCLQRKPRGEVM